MSDLTLPAPQSRVGAPNLGTPLLELIRQPLYSAMAFDAAVIPAETRAFQYQIGDTVSGAGAGAISATLYHTNMEVGGSLASPKVFEANGLKLVMSNITAPGTAAPAQPADPTTGFELHEDAHFLFWATHLSLHIGAKEYFSGPSWLAPANWGVSGYAATGMDDGAAAEAAVYGALQGQGKAACFDPYTILIPANQSFHVKLRAPQTTTPTLNVARLVWAVLEGRLGREAQ